MRANILTIAGSDCSGGAGIQADLKTISALGGYGLSAITALTAQNTKGVQGIHGVPQLFVREQLDSIAADVRVDAIKIGMLHDIPTILAVSAWLQTLKPRPPVVLDPVMVSTSGSKLLDPEAVATLMQQLIPLATVITPNIPELAVLSEMPEATSFDEAIAQAQLVAGSLVVTVVVKGGHLPGDTITNAVVYPNKKVAVLPPLARVVSTNTHGTGCTLSSALATKLGQNPDADLPQLVTEVQEWVATAIKAAATNLQVGSGFGPVDHLAQLLPAQTGQQTLASWWAECAQLRQDVMDLPFIKALADGSLPESAFVSYQLQDALYLSEYARVLAIAAAQAPNPAAQVFWAQSSQNCIVVERELHEQWTHGKWQETAPDEKTLGYTNHLLAAAARGNYAVLVAAILPCFWLYQEVADLLAAADNEAHPYHSWLATYHDPSFAEAVAAAKDLVAAAIDTAPPQVVAQMRQAFMVSMAAELAFFDRF